MTSTYFNYFSTDGKADTYSFLTIKRPSMIDLVKHLDERVVQCTIWSFISDLKMHL